MKDVISASALLGIKTIVVPFVDNASLSSADERDRALNFLLSLQQPLAAADIRIALEMDLSPPRFRSFLDLLPQAQFGVNYDVGNSASLGFSMQDELISYGSRVINVHLKDRRRNGPTVSFGTGDVNFAGLFELLRSLRY